MAVNGMVLRLLIAARGYVEKGWCRGAMARNARRVAVVPDSPSAVMWCASGAVRRAGLDLGSSVEKVNGCHNLLMEGLSDREKAWNWSISEWNDRNSRKKEEVLALFDRAILKLEGTSGSQEGGL